MCAKYAIVRVQIFEFWVSEIAFLVFGAGLKQTLSARRLKFVPDGPTGVATPLI